MKLKNIVAPVLAIAVGCTFAWVARELNHLMTIDIGELTDDESEDDAVGRKIEDVELPKLAEDVVAEQLALAQQALDEGQTLRPEQIELLLKAEGLAQRVRDETTASSVGKSLDNMVSLDGSGVVMEKKPDDPDIITEDQVHIDKPASERLPEPPPRPTAQDARLDPEWNEELRQASERDYTGGRKP